MEPIEMVTELRTVQGHRYMAPKPTDFGGRGVWDMDYCGTMGYAVQIPAYRLGGPKNL